MPKGRCSRLAGRFGRHSVFLVLFSLVLSSGAWGQNDARRSPDGVWQEIDSTQANALRDVTAQPWVQPQTFQAVALDQGRLLVSLDAAPLEFTVAARDEPLVITLPMPDGTFARFAVEEAPMMEAPLAAKYPQIKTYRGRGIDDPRATLRFDWTPQGFHAQVLSPNGAVYIDPMWRNNTTLYASYHKHDYRRDGAGFECLTHADPGTRGGVATQEQAVASGGTQILRKYRLALATTGEYTQFHGGTVALGLAAAVTAMNRVNGIYETEVAATMTLVANNDLIIYTNGGSDPYSNSDGFAMLGQNQSNLNSVIGNANYDIGHVFSTGGGGVAGLGVVCFGSQKGRGVTGLPAPIGDSFYVDFVAHEMGHQFGSNHCFNGTLGSCAGGNRNGSTAYEPGSGATIMAYAGICSSDNLQAHSDPYFHFISQQEIRSFIVSGSGNFCAVQVGTANSFPIADAGPDYVIPAQTPFTLTGGGSDPDLDPLTYTWEERDLGPGQTLSSPDNGSSPLIRSFEGTSDPTRTIPRLANILNGSPSLGEKLPTTSRSLKFRLTVRDNRPEGGAFGTDDMTVVVDALAGPFRVTAPVSGDNWAGLQKVRWDVANTNLGSVNTPNVNILLSVDGGLAFPTTLASNVPNTGSAFVTIPDTPTTTARIKVEGAGNIFFDISDGNFSIVTCDHTPDAPLAEPSPVNKNRYLSFDPNNAGLSTAFRITIVDLPAPFDVFNGQIRWAGSPSTESDGVGGTFVAAQGQCAPTFDGWFDAGVVHVYGDFVVPDGIYEIQAVQCDTGNETDFSPSFSVATAQWGDIVAPFGGTGQPNFGDVSALVASFSAVPGAPIRPAAQLHPNLPDPSAAISFQDISLDVSAFSGASYPFTGPTTCP